MRTAKWFSYTYTCVYSFSNTLSIFSSAFEDVCLYCLIYCFYEEIPKCDWLSHKKETIRGLVLEGKGVAEEKQLRRYFVTMLPTGYIWYAAAAAAAAAAKSLQSCQTLCDPIDGSPPGSAVPGILQARTLEWVAISFSNAWKWKVKVKSLSRFRLLATPWSAAYPAPLSMGFSRQKYWSGVPLRSPRWYARF